MWEDPIVNETRVAREELLERFNYDLDALCAYLEQQETHSDKKSRHVATETACFPQGVVNACVAG
jgi:hypothetical protein